MRSLPQTAGTESPPRSLSTQRTPASGPQPLMNAISKLATIKNVGMPKWKQAMYADHYMAECVLVGGARRAARIATKVWTDPEIFDFINIKSFICVSSVLPKMKLRY